MPSLTIKAVSNRFYMTSTPSMPMIELEAAWDAPRSGPVPVFNWTFALAYTGFIAVPGSITRNTLHKDTPVVPKHHPPMRDATGQRVRVPLTTPMCGVLTVSVETIVQGVRISARRDDIYIGGTNPSPEELAAAVQVPLMRRMIRQESGGNQFSDTGARRLVATATNPNWSGDGNAGVGLGQLTVPAPSDADVWNWRTNAADLQERFRAKRASGKTLHSRMMLSARYKAEAKALNEWRVAEGLPPVIPLLLPLNDEQLDREGLRAYNGFGFRLSSEYLERVHEYEPVSGFLTSAKRKTASGELLNSPRLLMIENGNAVWHQISGAERQARYGGRRTGEANYVAQVLAQNP